MVTTGYVRCGMRPTRNVRRRVGRNARRLFNGFESGTRYENDEKKTKKNAKKKKNDRKINNKPRRVWRERRNV